MANLGKILDLLLSDKRFSLSTLFRFDYVPIISIVVTVHNMESVILSHLTSILRNTVLPCEFLIVNDCSSDNSNEEIDAFVSLAVERGIDITVYFTRIPMYESRCEDFAIRQARGTYILLIQSDMKIFDFAYDAYLTRVLDDNASLFAISCRGVHSFSEINPDTIVYGREIQDSLFPRRIRRMKAALRYKLQNTFNGYNSSETDEENPASGEIQQANSLSIKDYLKNIFPEGEYLHAGFVSTLIQLLPYRDDEEIRAIIEDNRGLVWVGETIMRGPILFRSSEYLELGGFCVHAFYQGLDDHDLNLRASMNGRKVGFTPIHFSSPLQLGSMRRKKTVTSRLWSKLHAYVRRGEQKQSELFQSFF